MSKLTFWIKDWLFVLLNRGKCPFCAGKLHKNALGFHNCGTCFSRMMAEQLGEDPRDYGINDGLTFSQWMKSKQNPNA